VAAGFASAAGLGALVGAGAAGGWAQAISSVGIPTIKDFRTKRRERRGL
jgi:hypothetical protein